MPKQDDILIAVALTRFSVDFEDADPELSERAWQLAADRLLEHDAGPGEVVELLENRERGTLSEQHDCNQA